MGHKPTYQLIANFDGHPSSDLFIPDHDRGHEKAIERVTNHHSRSKIDLLFFVFFVFLFISKAHHFIAVVDIVFSFPRGVCRDW